MAEAECSDTEDGMTTHVLQEFLLGDVEVCGRELGVGSYSSVLELKYKGMRCAGKKIHRSLYDQGVAVGPEILERYETECELLSHLRHPCIVQFLGLYLDEGGRRAYLGHGVSVVCAVRLHRHARCVGEPS